MQWSHDDYNDAVVRGTSMWERVCVCLWVYIVCVLSSASRTYVGFSKYFLLIVGYFWWNGSGFFLR